MQTLVYLRTLDLTTVHPSTISLSTATVITITSALQGDFVGLSANPYYCLGVHASHLVVGSGGAVTIPAKFLPEGQYALCYSTNAAQSDTDYAASTLTLTVFSNTGTLYVQGNNIQGWFHLDLPQ